MELVRSIGADHVIDYTQEDFTTGGPRYDVILDNVGNHSLGETRRALTPDGTLIPNGGGHSGGGLGKVLKAFILSTFIRQQGRPSVKFQNAADLAVLKDLVDAGKVTPVVDAIFPLEAAAAAIDRVAGGHARGTVVLTMSTPSNDAIAPASALTLAATAS